MIGFQVQLYFWSISYIEFGREGNFNVIWAHLLSLGIKARKHERL